MTSLYNAGILASDHPVLLAVAIAVGLFAIRPWWRRLAAASAVPVLALFAAWLVG